jgi:acyl-CoA reductase-like NAD-dependent aldehyde dehydrogenase
VEETDTAVARARAAYPAWRAVAPSDRPRLLRGLTALVEESAEELALLETGVLCVNSNSSVRVTTPFGGFKQSGFGRELGVHALEGSSEIKNVFVSTD